MTSTSARLLRTSEDVKPGLEGVDRCWFVYKIEYKKVLTYVFQFAI